MLLEVVRHIIRHLESMYDKVFQICLNGQLLRILFVPSRMSLLRRSRGFDLPLLC